MVLLRMLMQSPRTECRAQPAGHACGPPLREAAARTARRAEQRRQQIVRPDRLHPNPKPFVILNEVKNLFPCEPKAACGLCRARKRKTNEVQSNICIVSIQILRRSAPQNDKLFIVRNIGSSSRWSGFNSRTHAGCDREEVELLNEEFKFQFTHPRGVRLIGSLKIPNLILFQFTHPRGVRLG